MVDAARLPLVRAGSRADRLKRPLDAEGVWLRISRSNGISEFPVRRDELNEDLAPVNALANTALETANAKVDAAQVLSMLNAAFTDLFQEYVLDAGVEYREVDPVDQREYIYTVFAIQTRYAGFFEELALVSNDVNETLLDNEYGTYKESGGRLILVFRDMFEGFVNGVAKIKLVGVPTITPIAPTINAPISVTPSPASAAAAVEMAVTFTGFDPANPYYSPRALFNGVEFQPVSDRLPGDIGVNNVIRFSSALFAGQTLPGQLTIAVDDFVSQPVTINP